MNPALLTTIESLSKSPQNPDRKQHLDELINYIQQNIDAKENVRLNFICTHNSRRSHISQIWAQTMAFHFGIKNVSCYSGGTEATAMFPKVVETLINQGFDIKSLLDEPAEDKKNIIYAVKFAVNEPPLVCFSKTFKHNYNPTTNFAAIMTCASADEGCPYIPGAKRIPVRYDDPKAFDGTDLMDAKYLERSIEIANDMYYVFSNIKTV